VNPSLQLALDVLAQDGAGDRSRSVSFVILMILGIALALLAGVGLLFGAYFLARWLVKQAWILWSFAGGGVLLLVGGFIAGITPVMLAGGLMIGLTILFLLLFAIGEM
jgi:hypothetical protein